VARRDCAHCLRLFGRHQYRPAGWLQPGVGRDPVAVAAKRPATPVPRWPWSPPG